jgi:uncharacterized protein YqeY
MNLTEQINNDIKAAMLAKNKEKLESLRAVKAALIIASTEKGAGGEVSEQAEMKMLQKLVKQRQDAADIYKQQNRADLAEAEMRQVSYIEPYLPKAMSDDELKANIKAIISEGGFTAADFGKIMGAATKSLAGKADNKRISEAIKAVLG